MSSIVWDTGNLDGMIITTETKQVIVQADDSLRLFVFSGASNQDCT